MIVEKMDDCEKAIRKNAGKRTISRHFFHIYLKELKRNTEIFNLDNPLSSKSNTKVPQTQSRSERATLPLTQTMRGN